MSEMPLTNTNSSPISNRSRVRRLPDRASYDHKVIFDILDRGFVCHLGFAQEDQVFVLPLAYVRVGESLFLHGSTGSRMLRMLARGIPVCVTVTHLDGLVLARSAFHHSFNYRSAVIFGKSKVVAHERKVEILDALMDHTAPGRKNEVRPPSESELNQVLVVEIPIEEASAKVRSGPPKDDSDDLSLDVWAGVLPFELVAKTPEQDKESTVVASEAPSYVLRYEGPFKVGDI